MRTTIKERSLLLLLLFVFFACIFRYIPGFKYDLECFEYWARMIHLYGLPSVYTISGTNYLPFYQYIMWMYAKIAGSQHDITDYIREIRLFTVVFEILGLWYIYKWIDKKTDFIMLVFVSLLNIGFSYNTIAWGQVDGIFSAFVFIAFYYAYKQKMLWSSVFIMLAVNAKLQAVVFVPLWLILCLNNLVDKRNVKTFLVPVVGIVITQLVLILPFITHPRELRALWEVIVGSDKVFPKISMQAYNIWHILLPKNVIDNVPDNRIYKFGLSYKHIGLILFCCSSTLAMFPVLKDVFRTVKYKVSMINKERLWLSAALLCLSFFFFNTQMHERYCHPVIVFLTAYAFYTRRFGIYILFSAAYFLDMEYVLSEAMLPHEHYVWYTHQNVAWMFAVVLVWMFISLYTVKDKSAKETLVI